jgi:ABC-2 type transport system ATP-binding protein
LLVEAHDLTRAYGRFLAVDHLSFQVGRGEIVGLLGPNGAGKTTTIRMLTGYLPPSEGRALIAGIDVRHDPVAAHRHIGYMPENNPLYTDMRVGEYLAFRAQIKGVPRARRVARIGRALEQCALGHVARQVIGTLSKGYRQRVGLADALLAEPDVLILDEPTIGLDPNQVRETRRLVAELGEGHTVLVSTHILAEAEAICRRVLIVDQGRIAADGAPGDLSRALAGGPVVVELRAPADEACAALRALAHVRRVRPEPDGDWLRCTVETDPEADVREAVAALAAGRGWPLRELSRGRRSLEDVFRQVTLGG